MNFIMFGVGGFVAEKHLKAIKAVGGDLVAALDPSDSVGILDRYFPRCQFFTEPERFDRWLSMIVRKDAKIAPEMAVVCSPNWLHDAHCRMAMRAGCDVICEKPVVINPWNVTELRECELEYNRTIYVMHQLRWHPSLVALNGEDADGCWSGAPADVLLTYCTPRGPWYAQSWKGDETRSGGIIMNLGIHFLDALLWVFGAVKSFQVHMRREDRMAGSLALERANVRWFLSTHPDDSNGNQANRELEVIGHSTVNFGQRFGDLHEEVYRSAIAKDDRSVFLEDAHPAINLAYMLRTAMPETISELSPVHPRVWEVLDREN